MSCRTLGLNSFDELRRLLLRSLMDQPLLFTSPVAGVFPLSLRTLRLLLVVEQLRGRKIQQLSESLSQIIFDNLKHASSPDLSSIRKSVSQLLPTWFVTYKNFEWKRSQTDRVATTCSQVRTWICPLLDVGESVVFVDDRDGREDISCVVADQLPPNDDSVVLLVRERTTQSSTATKIVPINSVRLQAARVMYRDPLIPSLEEEPAARCGSATLFSKLRFEFGVKAEDMNKVMRQIGKLSQEIQKSLYDEVIALEKGSSDHGDDDAEESREMTSRVEASPTSDFVSITLCPSRSSTENNWKIGKFHFVKLFIMFSRSNRGVFEPSLFDDVKMIIANSAASSSSNHVLLNQCIETIVTESSPVELDRFLCCLCRCIQRYRNFDGDDGALGNLHAAIHPAFALTLNARMELFANPFNASSIQFCSLFGPSASASTSTSTDTTRGNALALDLDFASLDNVDGFFGSQGTCWDVLPRIAKLSGGGNSVTFLEANPPFDTSVVQRLSRTLSSCIAMKSSDSNNNHSVTSSLSMLVVVVIPEPRTDVKHDSKYAPTVNELKKMSCLNVTLAARQAVYVKGLQQQQQQAKESTFCDDHAIRDDCITIQRDTAIIVVSISSSIGTAGRPHEQNGKVLEAIEEWRNASNVRNEGCGGSRRQRES